MDETLMNPDVCMMFLVWSYYYHDILPERERSYASYGRFSPEDVDRLDSLKKTLFLTVEEDSVKRACEQFYLAKTRKEPCPFSQAQLDAMFASPIAF